MWWVFLLTGIAWLVFAILVFQWDYTTVYAVSYLFGFVALIAGLNEFLSLGIWTTGWKILHGIVGAIFIAVGIWARVHPALQGHFRHRGLVRREGGVRPLVAPARARDHRGRARVLGGRRLPEEG